MLGMASWDGRNDAELSAAGLRRKIIQCISPGPVNYRFEHKMIRATFITEAATVPAYLLPHSHAETSTQLTT